MQSRENRPALLVAGVALAVLLLSGTMVAGATPPADGRLVFQSGEQTWVMDADGQGQYQVTGVCEGLEPSWRPGTDEIAFINRCGPTGSFEISAILSDGSGFRQLLTSEADDSGPDWSNDGRLALTSDLSGDRDVYVMNADGSNLVNLTNDPARDEYPSFSPDGTQIAFTSNRTGNCELYMMGDDGSHVTQLTFNPADDGTCGYGWGGGPSWSPDGRYIAFESDRGGNLDIYLLDLKTGKERRVTSAVGVEVNPAFSPDGHRIAFSSNRPETDFDIYTVSRNGGAWRVVAVRQGVNDFQPDWAGV